MGRIASRLLLTVVAALCAGGVAQASAVRAGTGSGRRALIQQAAAVPASASVTGAVAESAPVQVTLALTPSDPQALVGYAQQVSDPSSPLYRHYLSVAQFAARFGADPAQVASVRTALSQAGLSVGSVSANGLSLSASGSTADIEGAFDTQLERVTLADGIRAYADVTDPTLPAAAAGAVQTIAGLDTLPAAAPQSLLRARRAHADVSAHVGSNATGPTTCSDATTAGGYTAAQIGSAYGLDSAWNAGDLGAGATVALAELEPYHASDVSYYQTCDNTTATITNVAVDGGAANCWQNGPNYDDQCGVEDVLDIEDVAGLVPDANIDVYEAPNTANGLLTLYQSMVTADAPVISTSWGLCEGDSSTATLTAENAIFEEAAVQGEAVFAAAGDDGSDDCGNGVRRTVDDPASQPYVTGVGGTTLASVAPNPPESVWNDGEGAGGGGVSREWAQPSFQSGFALAQSQVSCTPVPAGSGSSTTCREVPDVSADADPATGYDIYWDGGWSSAGGTSAAAPTWAAVAALADGSSACTSNGIRVGFADALLYSLPAADFNDVTTGNNSYDGVGGYQAGSGYDMASGLGSPNGAALIPALCAQSTVTAPQTTTTTTTITATTTTPTTPAPTQTTTTPTQTTTTTTTPGTGKAGGVRFVAHRARRIARIGHRVRVVVHARDAGGLRLRYSARRLPRGLRINRMTGVISGRPTRLGRSVSSITARDSRGDAETIVIRWVVRRR